MLGAGGALLGLVLARAGIASLLALAPEVCHASIRSRSIRSCWASRSSRASLAAFGFGLVPALRASRTDVADVLREAGRNEGLARGRVLRNGVVIAEVALTFVLLIGSGLMMRSFAALQRVDPGFDPDGVLTFVANARGNAGQRAAFRQQMQERLRRCPV